MSKADDAQNAAQEARAEAFSSGKPVAECIQAIATEWSVEPCVVEAWVLRDPQFDTLEALDREVAAWRHSVAENEARRIERVRQREFKFNELAQIVDAIPARALLFATLNTVGFSHAQSWREWISVNCSEGAERDDAFAFATSRMKCRLRDGIA